MTQNNVPEGWKLSIEGDQVIRIEDAHGSFLFMPAVVQEKGILEHRLLYGLAKAIISSELQSCIDEIQAGITTAGLTQIAALGTVRAHSLGFPAISIDWHGEPPKPGTKLYTSAPTIDAEALVIERTHCFCHPETCPHGEYTLFIGLTKITDGSREQLGEIAALLGRLASSNSQNSGSLPAQPRPLIGCTIGDHMQTFNTAYGPRQWVQIKVTRQPAIITGVHIRDMNTPRYDLLYVTSIDNIRTELSVEEYEIEALPDGAARPFPDPFSSTSANI